MHSSYEHSASFTDEFRQPRTQPPPWFYHGELGQAPIQSPPTAIAKTREMRTRFDGPDSELKGIFSDAKISTNRESASFSRTPGPKKVGGSSIEWDEPTWHVQSPQVQFGVFTYKPPGQIHSDAASHYENDCSQSPDVAGILRVLSTPIGDKVDIASRSNDIYDGHAQHSLLSNAAETENEDDTDRADNSSCNFVHDDVDRLVSPQTSWTALCNRVGLHNQPLGGHGSQLHRSDRYRDANLFDDREAEIKPPTQYNSDTSVDSSGSGASVGQAAAFAYAPPRPANLGGFAQPPTHRGSRNDNMAISSSSSRVGIDDSIELRPKPSLQDAQFPTRGVKPQMPRLPLHSTTATPSGSLQRSTHSSRSDKLTRSLDGDKELLSSTHSSTEPPSALHLQFISSSSGSKSVPDLVESPRSKLAFKEFANNFRATWKISPQEAEAYALKVVEGMPEHARWRVFVELAELAKKLDDAEKARDYYIKACEHEHRASMIWLEWSKMEEENGKPDDALAVLAAGLSLCRMNESLLPRMVKLLERLRKSSPIRHILSSLKHENIDRTWKMLFEGCLFEAREGHNDVSRVIFKYLMKHVHWHGPIYSEAFLLEEREGNEQRAKLIAENGLNELKHYGPLWFSLMRLVERQDIRAEYSSWINGKPPRLQNLTAVSKQAAQKISKELTWRVYFERFQAEERAAEIAAVGLFHCSHGRSLESCRNEMLAKSRRSLAQSLVLCPTSPNNLRWRLFLVGARLELGVGNVAVARALLKRAFEEVPPKSKASVIIECSRLEEYLGRTQVARLILSRSSGDMNHDWKGYLERVLLEARAGQFQAAVQAALEAVRVHPGTGRLWALCIQLHHRIDRWSARSEATSISSTQEIIRRAIAEVPKSGEVWCEYARYLLNPFSPSSFHLGKAIGALNFAINFTPQYGDSFIEYLRVEMLCRGVLKPLCALLNLRFARIVRSFLAQDEESEVFQSALNASETNLTTQLSDVSDQTLREILFGIHQLQFGFPYDPRSMQQKFQRLERRCINADPNYGSAWFHCRKLPHDIPAVVLQTAQSLLEHELLECHQIYARATLHFLYKCLSSQGQLLGRHGLEDSERRFLAAYESCFPGQDTRHFDSLFLMDSSSWYCSADFVTGLVELNRTMFNHKVSAEVRRRQLFGTDQIIN